MLRRSLALLAAAALSLGLLAAPASAEVAPAAPVAAAAEQRVDPSCSPAVMGNQAAYFQFHDSFRCLGGWQKMGPYYNTQFGFCANMNQIVNPAYPAPNGMSNMMSSGFNQTEHRIEFYDAFNCSGAVLFAMNAFTYRDTLVDAANNKASSFKLVNN